MSRVQKMRMFVSQRLNAAVEEILAAFEKAIEKYDQEAARSQEVISRQHALLCTLHKPMMDLPSADVLTQQLLLNQEQVALNHKDQNPEQDVVPKTLCVEEKQQEEQILHLDEAEIIKFTYNSRLAAKPCNDLHLSAEPGPVSPYQDVPLVLSSETEDSEDYSKDSAGSRPASDKPPVLGRPKGFSCWVCSRTFKARRFLLRHVKAHLPEAKQVCGLCGEEFEAAEGLTLHLQTHCSKRKQRIQARTQSRDRRLRQRSGLNKNTKVPETQKPKNCNDCGRTLLKRRHRCLARRKDHDQENPGRLRKRKRKA
ncbi:uncharacterized protein [Leuresthes tenuis]|uniref:uncharacterized protein isoform X2 n=1 Tax=Leuresthes tenuis TaxID=355514 RepID=UPI003B5131C7